MTIYCIIGIPLNCFCFVCDLLAQVVSRTSNHRITACARSFIECAVLVVRMQPVHLANQTTPNSIGSHNECFTEMCAIPFDIKYRTRNVKLIYSCVRTASERDRERKLINAIIIHKCVFCWRSPLSICVL